MCGFESRVTDDLTTNMNQIVEVISSNAFVEQLKKAQSGKSINSL
jgi:mannitol/fructose-specific phosphotransferase system IIA component (Ntr-type)